MTVLEAIPQFTSVTMKGLDKVVLPWRNIFFDGDNSAALHLLADDSDKYVVKSITGLDPPDRTPAIARTASGGSFQGIQTEDREVVVLVALQPDWDAGETPKLLRDNLYTMLYTGYDPKVDFILNAGFFPLCHEYGYVTKFEAAIFDANPAVQITFSMLNPTFRAFNPTTYDPADLSETAPDIYNYATAETGFQFGVKFTGTRNGWFIKTAESQSIGMIFDYTFHDGDILTVSTIPGKKYVHLKPHRKKVKNMLKILTSDSEWIQLHPGHNHFLVPKKVSIWDWSGKLTFTPQFAGV